MIAQIRQQQCQRWSWYYRLFQPFHAPRDEDGLATLCVRKCVRARHDQGAVEQHTTYVKGSAAFARFTCF
jgi:hypothetical protein